MAKSLDELKSISKEIRKDIVKMLTESASSIQEDHYQQLIL